MSKEKAERRKAAGKGMDPAGMSMQMSPIPGAPVGPGNMNGNPMNVNDFGSQQASMDPEGFQDNIYRDGKYQYAQSGANVLNPAFVPRSQIQQNTPVTPIGNNSNMPFGLQQQPDANSADAMEGMRTGGSAMTRGLHANPFMGVDGLPALMPGAIAGSMAGTSGPPLMPPMTSMNPMTPGADKKVIKKKGKK